MQKGEKERIVEEPVSSISTQAILDALRIELSRWLWQQGKVLRSDGRGRPPKGVQGEITQSALAELWQIEQSQLSRILSREYRKGPTLDSIGRILEGMGLSYEAFGQRVDRQIACLLSAQPQQEGQELGRG